jgi:hypothetical protein
MTELTVTTGQQLAAVQNSLHMLQHLLEQKQQHLQQQPY